MNNENNDHVVPLVSVIMPTFNDREYIVDSITSVIEQTMTNWELIIVDDASTDGTADWVRQKFDDPRILLESMNTNSGSGVCRNRAISLARGKYVAILDADDLCLPSRLERQVGILESNMSVSVVASQVLEFGSWGGPVEGAWPTRESQVRAKQMKGQMPVAHPTVMFRKNLLEKVGGYDVACRRAQDFALFLKISKERIVCIEEPLVKYRTNRPVSLGYVIRNDKYAKLARKRHDLRQLGTEEHQLPTMPELTPGLVLRSFRNWSVRSVRELLKR